METNTYQHVIRRRLHARIWLSAVTASSHCSTTIAHTGVGYGRAEREGHTGALHTARLRLARVQFLAQLTAEPGRALALELNRARLDALGAVLARVGATQRGQFNVVVAAFHVRIVDEHLRALHDGELAEAVADDEGSLVEWMRDEVAWLSAHANVIADLLLLLLLLL